MEGATKGQELTLFGLSQDMIQIAEELQNLDADEDVLEEAMMAYMRSDEGRPILHKLDSVVAAKMHFEGRAEEIKAAIALANAAVKRYTRATERIKNLLLRWLDTMGIKSVTTAAGKKITKVGGTRKVAVPADGSVDLPVDGKTEERFIRAVRVVNDQLLAQLDAAGILPERITATDGSVHLTCVTMYAWNADAVAEALMNGEKVEGWKLEDKPTPYVRIS